MRIGETFRSLRSQRLCQNNWGTASVGGTVCTVRAPPLQTCGEVAHSLQKAVHHPNELSLVLLARIGVRDHVAHLAGAAKGQGHSAVRSSLRCLSFIMLVHACARVERMVERMTVRAVRQHGASLTCPITTEITIVPTANAIMYHTFSSHVSGLDAGAALVVSTIYAQCPDLNKWTESASCHILQQNWTAPRQCNGRNSRSLRRPPSSRLGSTLH